MIFLYHTRTIEVQKDYFVVLFSLLCDGFKAWPGHSNNGYQQPNNNLAIGLLVGAGT